MAQGSPQRSHTRHLLDWDRRREDSSSPVTELANQGTAPAIRLSPEKSSPSHVENLA